MGPPTQMPLRFEAATVYDPTTGQIRSASTDDIACWFIDTDYNGGETAETRFLSIDAIDITAAELRGKRAYITLRFVSQLGSATRDRNGKVIEGDAVNVTN